MSSNFEHDHEENEDYGKQFRPDREIYVVKKDGSKELFNVQKVISAVGKSAYRALTKFTKEEKEQICQYVVDKVNELEVDEVPIPIMHNIVGKCLRAGEADRRQKAIAIIVTISRISYGCWMMSIKRVSPSCTSEIRKMPTRIPLWYLPSVV